MAALDSKIAKDFRFQDKRIKIQEDTINHIISTVTDLVHKTDIKNCLPLAESSISFDLSGEMVSPRKGALRDEEPNETSFSDQSKCDCSNLSDATAQLNLI